MNIYIKSREEPEGMFDCVDETICHPLKTYPLDIFLKGIKLITNNNL